MVGFRDFYTAPQRERFGDKMWPEEAWYEELGDVIWWYLKAGKPLEAPIISSPLCAGHTVEIMARRYGPLVPGSKIRGPGGKVGIHESKMTLSAGSWVGYHTHFSLIPPLPELGK